KTLSLQYIRQLSETTREGSSLLGLSEAAEKLGFRSLGVKINLKRLEEAPLPCIVHWNKVHFVVLASLNPSKGEKLIRFVKKILGFKNSRNEGWKALVSDPAHGLISYNKEEFLKHWIGNNATEQTEEGI